MSNSRIFRNVCTTFAAALVFPLAGCGDGISKLDAQYVAVSMPPSFDSLRMYGAAKDNASLWERRARTQGGLSQGCQATVRTPTGYVEESVILDGAGAPFDLDVSRTARGWDVTADGFSSPKDNPNAFRAQFIKCVGALEDKYRSEPEQPARHRAAGKPAAGPRCPQ